MIVDQSYFLYYIIYGATAEFGRKFPQLAQHWIKPAEEVDQQNLPDLTACQEFTKTLRKFVMKRLETIDWLTKQHFQQELASIGKNRLPEKLSYLHGKNVDKVLSIANKYKDITKFYVILL